MLGKVNKISFVTDRSPMMARVVSKRIRHSTAALPFSTAVGDLNAGEIAHAIQEQASEWSHRRIDFCLLCCFAPSSFFTGNVYKFCKDSFSLRNSQSIVPSMSSHHNSRFSKPMASYEIAARSSNRHTPFLCHAANCLDALKVYNRETLNCVPN